MLGRGGLSRPACSMFSRDESGASTMNATDRRLLDRDREERWEEEEQAVPPVAVCARCGLPSCAGCFREPPAVTGLPWEDSRRHWVVRLWQTALVSGVEPERTFGGLTAGGVARPLAFALLAETLALGSLLVSAAALLWLADANLARALLYHPVGIGSSLGLLALSVLVMLTLHVLWGVSLDVGGKLGRPPMDVRQGARFGLYACGWDLVTSPIGVFCSLIVAGPLRGLSIVVAAARAAGPAQRAYLESGQRLGPPARRRARRFALLVVGVAVSLLGAALLGAFVWVAGRFGY
jgi:hypothetical protein